MQSRAKESNQGLHAAAVNQNVEDIVKQRNQKSICKAYALCRANAMQSKSKQPSLKHMQSKENAKESNQGLHAAAAVNQNFFPLAYAPPAFCFNCTQDVWTFPFIVFIICICMTNVHCS